VLRRCLQVSPKDFLTPKVSVAKNPSEEEKQETERQKDKRQTRILLRKRTSISYFTATLDVFLPIGKTMFLTQQVRKLIAG